MGGTGETRAGAPWWPELSLLAAFGVLTAALAAGALLDLDVAVRDWCDTHQPHAAHLLSPERSIEIQRRLGADITMAFDECTPFPAECEAVAASMELSMRWAERSRRAFVSRC